MKTKSNKTAKAVNNEAKATATAKATAPATSNEFQAWVEGWDIPIARRTTDKTVYHFGGLYAKKVSEEPFTEGELATLYRSQVWSIFGKRFPKCDREKEIQSWTKEQQEIFLGLFNKYDHISMKYIEKPNPKEAKTRISELLEKIASLEAMLR